MKVLFISSIYPPDVGGPATYVSFVNSELQKRGWQTDVVTYGNRRIKLWPLPLKLLAMTLVVLKKGADFDVFYANGGLSASLPAVLAGFILGKKVIVKVTGDYAWEQARNRGWTEDDIDDFQQKSYDWKINLLKKLRGWVVKLAHAVVVPSLYLKNMVLGWGVNGDKIAVIYNSCNFTSSQGVKIEGLIFSAGRLVSWKGFEKLVNAFAAVRTEFPHAQLVIAGDGPVRDKLKGDGVQLVGPLAKDEMKEWYSRASCFVLFSGYEGLSHVLLEAMACGLPVIVSRKGGNVELVRDEVNGLVVPFFDEVALQDALRRFLKNPAIIPKPGLLNARNFSQETMMARTMHLLSGNKFFIMRHAQSDHNVGGWISADETTDQKSNLTPLGLEQARNLARQLKDMQISAIYCSPFQRVTQTCEIINEKIHAPVIVDERLRQFDCGVFNGKPWSERDKFFSSDLEKLTKRPPGGENFIDLSERMLAAFNDINSRHKNSNILLISHGNPLRVLQWAVLGLSDEALFDDMRVLKWKSNVTPEPEVGELLLV